MTDARATDPILLDAVAEHRAAPRTFSIPRRAIRENLYPGDVVKLLFVVAPPVGSVTVERLWVEVTEAGDGRYVGRLESHPGHVRDVKAGDRVAFRPEHVAAKSGLADASSAGDDAVFAVVSRRVWNEDAWPRRLERRAVPDAQFSGWFVFSGDEDEGYLVDPANFVPVPQATLFERFRVPDSGLEGPVGTTMLWNDEELEFEAAPPAGD